MISRLSVQAPAGEERDIILNSIFPAVALQALFWRPRFLVPSLSTQHLPLFFWLATVLRPDRVAVLGCDDGVIHFGLCQALEKLVPNGICRGFGYWSNAKEGKNTEQGVPDNIRAHEDLLYSGVSELGAAGTLEEVIAEISREPVGLLCLDLQFLPADAIVDLEQIMAALSETGVLVVLSADSIERRLKPGKDLDTAIGSHRRLIFGGKPSAMAVLNEGASSLPVMRSLLVDAGQGALAPDVSSVFSRSGQMFLAEARQAWLEKSRSRAEKQRAAMEVELDAGKKKNAELSQDVQKRSRKIVDLQTELFEKGRELAAAQSLNIAGSKTRKELELELLSLSASRDREAAELVGAREQLALLESEKVKVDMANARLLETLSSAAEDYKVQLAEMTLRCEQAAAESKVRLEEVVQLTQISEELRAKIGVCNKSLVELTLTAESYKTQLGEMTLKYEQSITESKERLEEIIELTRMSEEWRAKSGAYNKMLTALQKEGAKNSVLTGRIRDLYASRSWKITRPLRWLASIGRRWR